MPLVAFEPVIPDIEWPQTYALDGAATGIGQMKIYFLNHLTLFTRKRSWLTMYRKITAVWYKNDTEKTVT
jgi:hypothetical protein